MPLIFASCNSDTTAKHEKAAAQAASAAQQVYVAPGKLDDYYAFLSGGQSGSVFVYGIPSCRFIKEIPDLRTAAPALAMPTIPVRILTSALRLPARSGATPIIRY